VILPWVEHFRKFFAAHKDFEDYLRILYTLLRVEYNYLSLYADWCSLKSICQMQLTSKFHP